MLAGRTQGQATTQLSKNAVSCLPPGIVGTHFGAQVGVIGCSELVIVLNQSGDVFSHVGKGHLQLVAYLGKIGRMGIHGQQYFVAGTPK